MHRKENPPSDIDVLLIRIETLSKASSTLCININELLVSFCSKDPKMRYVSLSNFNVDSPSELSIKLATQYLSDPENQLKVQGYAGSHKKLNEEYQLLVKLKDEMKARSTSSQDREKINLMEIRLRGVPNSLKAHVASSVMTDPETDRIDLLMRFLQQHVYPVLANRKASASAASQSAAVSTAPQQSAVLAANSSGLWVRARPKPKIDATSPEPVSTKKSGPTGPSGV